jgi:putative integral membrane protein (TIGR02587 family)
LTGADRRLLVDLTRGICGGCLFAMPMIYTMEMWWLGYGTHTAQAASYLVATGVLAFGLNALAGYRKAHGRVADTGDALISIALGILVSAVLLAAIGEFDIGNSALVCLKQTILLAIPVSIGVSISRVQLGGATDDDEVDDGAPTGRVLLHRLGIAVAGALLLGMSAAPTEEIRMIASRIEWPHLLALGALSLGLTWATVFVAELPEQPDRVTGRSPWGDTVLTYALGLATAAVLMSGFGYLRGQGSAPESLAIVITLGLPTTLGAAIARLTL